MARTRGKRTKCKPLKKLKENEEKAKDEQMKNENLKRVEEKSSIKASSYFKSEEIQEICGLLNLDELNDHHCFIGAVVIGKFDVVKKLLKDGCIIDTVDETRKTALMHAVMQFRMDMVDFLVTRGADISLKDVEGNSAILLAAQSILWDEENFSGLLQRVLDNTGVQINHANKAGYSLLHCVIKRQWQSVLCVLLSRPITVDCCTNKGVTPLIMAASRGDSEMVRLLLEAGSDISIEDQHRCTALCYAIAFHMQKRADKSDKALEILVTALSDENSKTSLEHYLERRLTLLVNPPKNKEEFSKTVNDIVIHVLTFFARFVYSGMDLLLELRVFHKLSQALTVDKDDSLYVSAVLGVVLGLVKHCDCCCQGLSQAETADAFFSANLGHCLLDILTRFGTAKTGIVKAVFLPLMYLCTSESYLARTWLERNSGFLQPYYNKYTRSFPAILMGTNANKHLEIEKEVSLSFEKIMKVLKGKGKIVTKEEHLKASLKRKENRALAHSMNRCQTSLDKTLDLSSAKKKKIKSIDDYNSVIQYNFKKSNIVSMNKDCFKSLKDGQLTPKRDRKDSPLIGYSEQKSEYTIKNESKSRIAIKEIQLQTENNFEAKKIDSNSSDITISVDNILHKNFVNNSNSANKLDNFSKNLPLKSLSQDSSKVSKQLMKERFSEGYELFQMDYDSASSEEESPNISDWKDIYASGDTNQVVSDLEVFSTLKELEEILNRIICRYNSTWLKQYNEGYLGATGDCEELLTLMKILPALEEFHIKKLLDKWSKFTKQIKDCARKNHIVYAATVSDMQLFLLEFEKDLDDKNYKVVEKIEASQVDTDSFLKNVHISNVCSSPIIRKKMIKRVMDEKQKQVSLHSVNVETNEETRVSNKKHTKPLSDYKMFNSAEVDENIFCCAPNDKDGSIWDSEAFKYVKLKRKLNDCGDYNFEEQAFPVCYLKTDSLEVDTKGEKQIKTDFNLNKTEISFENEQFLLTKQTIQEEDVNENILDSKYKVLLALDNKVDKDDTELSFIHRNIHMDLSHENVQISGEESFSDDDTETVVPCMNEKHCSINQEGDFDGEKSISRLQVFPNTNERDRDHKTEEQVQIENVYSNTTHNKEIKPLCRPPPGFEKFITLKSFFDSFIGNTVPNYCGTKYQSMCLSLATLPACKTELLDCGRLRLASIDFQFDFKLFNGFNFGDVELGLYVNGSPLAVRRFQKVETLCNKNISQTLMKLIPSLQRLSHPHILPYLACSDLSHFVVFAVPLCYQDLGQYIRQLRPCSTTNLTSVARLTPHLITLARQLMCGLHFLHTQDKPVVHGNLKPSNIMVDTNGTLRLAEFGLQEVLFQQRNPSVSSVIWWPKEVTMLYFNTWKYMCTLQSDMQTAGMLVHFILTLGHHPFGQNLPEIVENIKRGVVQVRCPDIVAADLLYWMLSDCAVRRPTTANVLRHTLFWSSEKICQFLLTCCGLGTDNTEHPLPLELLYSDLDQLGKLQDVNTKWISALKENCEAHMVTIELEENTPSGLLQFLKKNRNSWTQVKDIFLELFPAVPLNLYRLVEQTDWIHHVQFEPFVKIETY